MGRGEQCADSPGWIFPDPFAAVRETPVVPAAAYQRLKAILKEAELPDISFHALCHTFSATALENGMDVKTLSAVIVHESAEITLNVYSHVTDRMQEQAAQRFDAGIVHAACDAMSARPSARVSDDVPNCDDGSGKARSAEESPVFVPYQGQIRRRGTGCVSKINDHLWEGRYSPRNPDGTRGVRNVYAHSEEECEQKLAELIRQMKEERTAAKAARR